MAVFQPCDKTVEISVQGTYDGQLVENKFYAQAVEVITSTMVDAMATVVAGWVHDTMLAHCNPSYVHSRVVARDLTSEASFESIDSSHAGEAGTVTGTPQPGNVTIAIHRATEFSGKKQKSRIYWPGLVNTYLSSPDVLTTVAATALIADLEALRTAILDDSSATWAYGYPQRFIDKVRLTAANFIPVFGHTVTDLNLDSQRRRLKGRGR